MTITTENVHWHSGTTREWPGSKGRCCLRCGAKITAGNIIVQEIRNDAFRGDDIVNFYHDTCAPRRCPPELRAPFIPPV